MNRPPFERRIYYLHGRPTTGGSIQTFYSETGEPRLVAPVAGFPKEVAMHSPTSAEQPLLLLRPWRWFPVNGRYDVLDGANGDRLGVLHRGGGIFDDAEEKIGSMVDPTSTGEQIGTSVANAVIDAVVSGGEGRGAAHRPRRLHLRAGDELAGVFERCVLPFALRPAREGASPLQWLRQVLPVKVGSALEAFAAPQGWRLDFSGPGAARIDIRLCLAAALLRAEIERRFNY